MQDVARARVSAPATQALLYVFILVFLCEQIEQVDWLGWFALWPPGGEGQFHLSQLATYGFMHGSVIHLGLNGLLLWMFGRVLEAEWGSRAYLLFFFAGLVVSGAAYALTGYLGWAMSTNPIVGCSGGLSALLAAYAVKHPSTKIMLLFPPIPMHAPVAIAALFALDAWLAYVGVNIIAHSAHWGGLLAGLAMSSLVHTKNRLLP